MTTRHALTRRLHALLVIVAMVALLPMGAAAVPADTTDAPEPATRATLLRLLNADTAAEQARGIRLIGTYAHTGRRDASFLGSFVTPLHGLVSEGETEAVRLMAVSALATIGTDRAMEGLRTRLNTLQPDRVRTVTAHAIAAYDADRAAALRATPER